MKRRRSSGRPSRRSTKTKNKGRDVSPDLDWPPRRSHHLPPQSPETKLRLQKKALVEKGVISSIDELPSLATKYARGEMSREEWKGIFGQVDEDEKEHSE